MNLFKNNRSQKVRDRINDQLAVVLAGKLIKVQCRMALSLNAWFNSLSISQRKWIALTFVLLVSVILITGMFSSFYNIPLPSQGSSYTSAHIGLPSGLPPPQFSKRQFTDSLTIKIKSWKQNRSAAQGRSIHRNF